MADSTEVAGVGADQLGRIECDRWLEGYAAALEDVDDLRGERTFPTTLREWLAQPMATARLAMRRRLNGGRS